MNDRKDRDDFVHAVQQTYRFYKKDFEDSDASFFWTACKDIPVAKLKAALIEHTRRSHYKPMPAHIIDIANEMGQRAAQNALPPPPTNDRKKTELDAAWPYCIKWFCQSSDGVIGQSMSKGFQRADADTEQRYLHMVNHHAKSMDMPDAIPEEFRLREVWG